MPVNYDGPHSPLEPVLTVVDASISSATQVFSALTGDKNGVAMLVASGQNVWVTFDGTTPSTSNGILLKTTDPPLVVALVDLTDIYVLESTASGKIWAQAFRAID